MSVVRGHLPPDEHARDVPEAVEAAVQLVRSAACAARRVRLADVQDVQRRHSGFVWEPPLFSREPLTVRNGIPRFVPDDGYAESFGDQWNRWRRVQLDSVTGKPLSRDAALRGHALAGGPRRGQTRARARLRRRDASRRCCSTRAPRSGRWTRRRPSTLRARTSASTSDSHLAQADLFDLPFERRRVRPRALLRRDPAHARTRAARS